MGGSALELSVVIPAYDEEPRWPEWSTVTVRQGGASPDDRDPRVRRRQQDGTAAALAAAGARGPRSSRSCATRPISVSRQRRKRLCGNARGQWIYFAPADGQVPAAALETIWRARDGAALVVGRQIPRRDPGGAGAHRRAVLGRPPPDLPPAGPRRRQREALRRPAQRACGVARANSSRPRCSSRAADRARARRSLPVHAARCPSRRPSSTVVRSC